MLYKFKVFIQNKQELKVLSFSDSYYSWVAVTGRFPEHAPVPSWAECKTYSLERLIIDKTFSFDREFLHLAFLVSRWRSLLRLKRKPLLHEIFVQKVNFKKQLFLNCPKLSLPEPLSLENFQLQLASRQNCTTEFTAIRIRRKFTRTANV